MSVGNRGNGDGRVRESAPRGADGEGGRPGAHISGVAYSGALILIPSFRRLQKFSSICTPGYGAPPVRGGVRRHRARRGFWVQNTTVGGAPRGSSPPFQAMVQSPVTGMAPHIPYPQRSPANSSGATGLGGRGRSQSAGWGLPSPHRELYRNPIIRDSF